MINTTEPLVMLYARAQRLWDNNLSALTDAEALEVCDLNSSNIDNPNTVFVWEIIRCKVKARQKQKAKSGARQ